MHAEMHSKPFIAIDHIVVSSEVAYPTVKMSLVENNYGKDSVTIGVKEKLQNKRRHSAVINPGAKSTSSLSAHL